MIEYSFLFENIDPPTHCSGKDNKPPIVSAKTGTQCDVPGCRGTIHHSCARRKAKLDHKFEIEIRYCECPKLKNSSQIRHYFATGNINLVTNRCAGCEERCNNE